MTKKEDTSDLTAVKRKEIRRKAFEELCQMTKKVQLEDEKKLLAEYRDEKYGR